MPMPSSKLLIKKTTNYGMFDRAVDNRVLKLRKHKRLLYSFEKYGSLPYWPIVVFKNGASKRIVKDGQHRLAICEQLGLPVHYVDCDIDFSIAEINNTQKVWQTVDYAEVYAANGIRPYQEGLEFASKYGISVAITFALLGGTSTFSNIEKSFKEGTFKIKDRPWADQVVGIYCPIAAISSGVKNTRFLEACMAACRVELFAPKRLLQGVQRCRDKLVSFTNRDAYLDMMEEIYNFGRKKLFPLKIEATMVMRERNATVKSPKQAK